MLTSGGRGEASGTLPSSTRPTGGPEAPLRDGLLDVEASFYGQYRWCLDAFPTVSELREHLRRELGLLETIAADWRREEVASNVYLLSCALANAVDDHLAGPAYDFSKAAALLGPLRPAVVLADSLLEGYRRGRATLLRGLRRWRGQWGAALHAYLLAWLWPREPEAGSVPANALGALLERLSGGLAGRRVTIPAAFRSQDLTHHDVIELAIRFASETSDRERPLLVVGLRTAGSYFVPLVHASLTALGYTNVETVTLRPKGSITRAEQASLVRCARREALALVVDEPPDTGGTLARVVSALSRAGVARERVLALVPIHPTRRDWRSTLEALPLARVRVIELDPNDWHKERLLDAESVERALRPYFRARGYRAAEVVDDAEAQRFNNLLKIQSEEAFHTRLKRVHALRLATPSGGREVRYVLAKSVGWGYLAYHAFLAGESLAGFLPPVLGLRHGILYTEWLPQYSPVRSPERVPPLRRLAEYVATRARFLGLPDDPGPGLPHALRKGHALLAAALSGAYGGKAAAVLQRARLQERLATPCPVPTLIDGKMRPSEWVRGPDGLLKTDFEHHGMGKTELNLTDPAYDLAEAIRSLKLAPADEAELVRHYRELTGDQHVEERLFLQKLQAGTVAMSVALGELRDPRLRHRHPDANRTCADSTEFLSTEVARRCGALCRGEEPPRWRKSVVVLDLDGVLDKQFLGFPCTTAAGIEALRLFEAHGFAVALDTARPLSEVKSYCRAYGFVGGVAEYGSVVWDAVHDRTRTLVSPETASAIERVAQALRRLPGVFLNERCRHSLRAYAYEGKRTVPLPTALIEAVVHDLDLTPRVTVRQTYVDTTVVAAEVDKGKGMLAMLELAGVASAETIAIGDSEADIPMFQAATRSFAPAHVSSRGVASALGCRIAPYSYQRGLLWAARAIVHPRGGKACRACEGRRPRPRDLFWQLLEAADRPPLVSLLRAAGDPRNLGAFRR